MDRLQRQLEFIAEMDRLKLVLRRSVLADGSRFENSAEHSWHIAMVAMVFTEYAPAGLNLGHVLRMLAVHDVVEIDAGDTYAYDQTAQSDRHAREVVAAERIFGLLPDDQKVEFSGLWQEFEDVKTAESLFANAVDRLQPVLLNLRTAGGNWRQNKVTLIQVQRRLDPVRSVAPDLWTYVDTLLLDAGARGYLDEET